MQVGYALVPQLLRTRYFNDPAEPRKLHETSWLDGLRGLAAVFVFLHHYLNPFTDMGLLGFDDSHRYWIQLPIIRFFYCGAAQVTVFFIIGGYILAKKPLELMHQCTMESHGKLLHTLFSTSFRRYFRLFLPVVASTQLVLWGTYFGLFDFVNSILDDRMIFPRFSFRILPRLPTLYYQYRFWLADIANLTNFAYERPYDPVHDLALWTLPFEFRAGITLITILLAVSRLSNHVRLCSLLGLSAYYLNNGRWSATYFLWGACIAQLDVIQKHKKIASKELGDLELSGPDPSSIHLHDPTRKAVREYLHGLFLLVGLYFFSAPEGNFREAYGYRALASYYPLDAEVRHFIAIGTLIMLFTFRSCDAHSPLRWVLNHNWIQYLAKISFSIYLLHGPVLRVIGVYIPIYIWKFIPREQTWSYTSALFIGWCCNFALVLWAADVFEREIDRRIVIFTKWLEMKCTIALN